MTSQDRDPVSISESVNSVVNALFGPGGASVGGVFGQWEEVVGDQVAAHVRPIRLDGTHLVVEVDDPAWATQVEFLSSTIISRVSEVVGATIDRIEITVGRPT
ncbi:MAG: hypothetical protein CSA55_06220 [Ilumatobacter coccineus]|uniref:DUF721 domain-containing protein n=1 Tax=Ilumatobacter coccineus TaxID=467094 RepID=A0A2G6K695_9ACTN|nr:MAG: hypothetical protein CSA55_06220 [Ilumatobacter coccineus]